MVLKKKKSKRKAEEFVW